MSKQKNVLGKGLNALLPSLPSEESEPVSIVPTADSVDDGSSIGILVHIEVEKIEPNPYQPRKEFDAEALGELAQSIREKGLVQPVTVRRFEDHYQLISGERRLRACHIAEVRHIPAYILNVSSAEEMIELSLIENIQREQLNPIEIALSYRQLIDLCNHTHDMIAQKVGKDRSTVANTLRLLKLPSQIQESIRKGEVNMGHARALINLPDEPTQVRIWRRIVMDGLSVRKVEELVKETGSPAAPRSKTSSAGSSKPVETHAHEVVTTLQQTYGTKVSLSTNQEGSGNIAFSFYSREDLERLIDLLLSIQQR